MLASEIGSTVLEQVNLTFDEVKLYSDRKVVLGYINNRTRRFFNYVSNRVDKIHRLTKTEQWNYIPSEHNPANCGTRGLLVETLHEGS